ncbi:hypothetical protein DPMN_003586 [Dreissena polymorpha]|uniref:THAP-type domain-containing protein n=2 Tax=Dreissena polymorpha TaxID=45954 RepID=A0A9D4MLU5_DREPO|nr:hypothetical protein DPMN_003586 [Dreissena polymorpha]
MDDAVKKKARKTRKYCCICKGIYRGMIIDDRKVSMHRFPQDKCLKRVWIQRCKTVMRTFKWNANKFLCSEHFVGLRGPTENNPLPSMFPTESGDTKTFPTTSLESTDCNNNSDVSDDISLNDAFLTIESDDDENYQPGPHFNVPDIETIMEVSAYLHDYCALPVLAPKKTGTRATYVQAEPDMRYGSTQTETDPIKKYTTSSTQTKTHTCEVGIQCSLPLLTYYDVKDKDEQLCFYTGIPSNEHFQAVFDEIKDNAEEQTSRRKVSYTTNQGGRPRSLSVINEFFMVLMRLRLGLLIEDLAFRFCLSKSQCSDIVNRWIDYLSVQLAVLVQWPSIEVIKSNMPKLFKDKFPDTRIIVDCTEIYTEVPSSLQLKSLMYSDYKSHMTYKALVGISPNGVVTFVSDLWCGSISDKQITKECGLL